MTPKFDEVCLILSSHHQKNRGLLSLSRRRSTRLRSAPGSTPQGTWTSAAKVGCCWFIFSSIFSAYLLSPCFCVTLPCQRWLKACLAAVSFLSLMLYLHAHKTSNASSDNKSLFDSDLEECESYLLELNLLLKSMEVLHRTYSAPAISALQVSTGTQIATMLNVEVVQRENARADRIRS